MIRVIPCLDVNRGRVVKGVNFVGLRDAGDPVELAARYDREGADELVFLDITASHEGRGTIVELARRTAEEVFIPFTIGGGLRPLWLVNGKTFDPSRSDAFPVLGTTEAWELHNATAVAHTIHMHHTDWYMISRNGKPPPPWERCLKETFFLDPGDRVVVAGHFSDYTGKYVIHCHMLDHEDHGLMSQFEVVA